MPKKTFLTFASQQYYHALHCICNEAAELEYFDEINNYIDNDLKQDYNFWQQHGVFIENNCRGYGYWIWKSYLIKQELDKLADNDILIYCDAGCSININGKERLLEYIDLLNTNKDGYGILAFQFPYKELEYTKRKIFEYFECSEEQQNMLHCLATIILIKKNAHSMNIINKWYEASTHYYLINDDIDNEHSLFKVNRHDQSLLSVLVNKYGSVKLPDETYFEPDWNNGRKYPFLATRGNKQILHNIMRNLQDIQE